MNTMKENDFTLKRLIPSETGKCSRRTALKITALTAGVAVFQNQIGKLLGESILEAAELPGATMRYRKAIVQVVDGALIVSHIPGNKDEFLTSVLPQIRGRRLQADFGETDGLPHTTYEVDFPDGVHMVFCIFHDASRSAFCYDLGNKNEFYSNIKSYNSWTVEDKLVALSKPDLLALAEKKLGGESNAALASAEPFDFR